MKKIMTITISFMLLFMIAVLNFNFKIVNASSGLISNDTDATQYIGYGYNVAGGKAICDPDALNLNSPILNMDNEELQKAIKVFNSSKTTYLSNTSSSVTEIAEEYGQIMSGDLGLSVGASASQAMSGNINIDVAFNTSKNSSWSSTYSEEYSYFNIVAANKPVILQINSSELKNYLSDSFMKDLRNVNSEKAAKNLIEKYGTHLLTGYTLGGIFEMTNYYATDSSSYVRQQETSFSAQVNAAISYMAFSGGANLGFSFTDTYGAMDNNTHAVNNYKCTTHGGYVFPGLTIDQAFSYYETLTDAGYMYKIWTDSINTGNNLVIVEIPQSSKLVPLWDLVPYSNEYHPQVREFLINAYMNVCETAYENFTSEHRDVRALGIPDEDYQIEYGFTEKGYQYYYQINDAEDYVTTYVNTYDNPTKVHDLISGSVVAMDYDEGDYLGATVEWSFGNMNQYIEWKDTQTGVFKVLDDAPNINNVVLTATVDGNQIVYKKTFNIKKKADFKAGDGTKENPYLITNTEEFLKISNDGYANGGYYFKLLCDLDFKGKSCYVIGSEDKPFNGVFDGNYYTIYNYKLDFSSAKENEKGEKYLGLFGYNDGTIKNLNLSEKNGGDYEYINTKNGLFSKLNYLGGIVAINRSKGIVENCHISGFTGKIKVPDSGINDTSEIMVGGIVAYNQGAIKYCSIKKSLIFAKGENENTVYSGGIVAKNENNTSDVSIESCLAEDSYIFVHVGTEYDTINGYAYGGGICGRLISGIISNCISLDFDNGSKNVPVEGEAKIRAVIYSQSYYKCEGFLGGIVGKAEEGTCLSYCLVKNISSILSTISPNDSRTSIKIGSFAGELAANVTIENCIIEEVLNVENKTQNQYYINNSHQINGDITVLNKITWDKVKDQLDENAWKCSSNTSHNGDNYPIPNFDIISSFSIDFSNAKLEFLKGEEFKTGNMLVTALHENGDMLAVNSFIINWNDYVKSFEQEFKYFTIFVYCCSLQSQYEVFVREPIYTSLNATLGNEFVYYEGDYLNLNDLHLEMIKENGSIDESISILDCTIYNKTTNSFDLKMVNGVNEIVIEYLGVKDSIFIDVFERPIDRIAVEIGEKAKEKIYYVGEKVIDTNDITIIIYYDTDGIIEPKIVSLSEGELIFSELVEGENEILVNYGNYKTATFTINVQYDTSKYNKIGFIDAVNEIENVTSLNEKYLLIVKANKALKELSDFRDAEINESIEKLNAYIIEYNNLANTINKDFDKTVEVGNSIVYTVLYFTSFSLLGILITLLRKKVQ